jgi:ubiquinone/menaquinone biosynthesis C-methylase UbiE
VAERDRLVLQAKMFEAEAAWLLDRCGITTGGHAVDVGCGPLGVLDLLSARVGSDGRVVGLDNEPRMLATGADLAQLYGLGGVEWRNASAFDTGLERRTFDLAHARLVLVNVTEPERVVAEMASLVRPGGMVALQEVDCVSWICEPPHPAWDRLRAAIDAVWTGNLYIGRRLPTLLREAGLTDVRFRAVCRTWVPGDAYHTLLLTFAGLYRTAILDRELLTEAEFAETVAALERHLADPATMTVYALFCQAWGRIPA